MGLLDIFRKKTGKRNINLLPEEEGESVFTRRDFIIALLIPVGTVVFLGVVLFFLLLFGTQASLKHSDLAKKIQQKQTEWGKYSEVASGITEIKTNITTYQDVLTKNKNVRSIFDVIRSDIPITLTLSKIDLSEKGEVLVEGTAPKAVDVYQYLQVLKNKTENYTFVVLKTITYNGADSTYKFGLTFSVKPAGNAKNK